MEIWKEIEGFEGLYEVSNKGNVRSLTTGKLKKFFKGKDKKSNYWRVTLFKNNRKVHKLVHVLVATAFVPNPNNKPEINHKNGDKLNNEASNLEWVTRGENLKHAWDTGLKVATEAQIQTLLKNHRWGI